MSELTFLSALDHRFSDFLAFRRVGGIDSKSDRELLRYFDRVLAQDGFCGPWPTREVITEYLASIGHLNPRTQQNRLSLIRQFCRGLRGGKGCPGPRLHHLRHSFACHRLLAWYREGKDINALLPVLATYLGHVSIASTQVYLHASAALLEQASARFHENFRHNIAPKGIPS